MAFDRLAVDIMILIVYVAAGMAALWHTVDQLVLLRHAATARGRTSSNGVRDAQGLSGPARMGLAEWPFVVVQLPVFNEPRVILRLLDAVARLDYPVGRWRVQVLDDSTDVTPLLVQAWMQDHDVPPVEHRRRAGRSEFKAGALAGGLAAAGDADLVAVLDADFVPAPDFLRRCVDHLSPGVAVVQGAWGHLNADQSPITVAGAVMMDNHFQVEQPGRQASGSFRAFNGSGGVIVVAALRAVGGWSGGTLTEDFDLSLRLQLAGWSVVYDPSIIVPAELPATRPALRLQQHRWMRGVAQNARLHLRRLIRSGHPLRVQVHLLSQVLESSTFVAIALQVVMAPVIAWRVAAGAVPGWVGWNPLLLAAFGGLVPVYAFSLQPRVPALCHRLAQYLQFILVSSALSLHNALAVVAGWSGRPAAFERTPKLGDITHEQRSRAQPTFACRRRTMRSALGRRRRATRVAEALLGGCILVGCGAVLIFRPAQAGYLWPTVGWLIGSVLLAVNRDPTVDDT